MLTVLVIFAFLIICLGDVFSKEFSKEGLWDYGIFAVITYAAGTFVWLQILLRTKTLGITGTLWNIGSILAGLVIGVVLYNEQLSCQQWIGIIFAIAAIVLLTA